MSNPRRLILTPLIAAFTVGAIGVSLAQAKPLLESLTAQPAPIVKITSGPAAKTQRTIATFTFRMKGIKVTADCRIDKGAFHTCHGTGVTYRNVKQGTHTFTVRVRSGKRVATATRKWMVMMPPPPPPPANQIPILMYHVIAVPAAGTPNLELWVDPSEFQAEVDWLYQNGFTAVTMQQWWDSWHGGAALPAHPVMITMDDGFATWYTNAAPILAAYHWPANMELAASHYDQQGWGLTDKMLNTLINTDGWELDSHSMTHPNLTTVSDAQLTQEITGSRQLYQQRFGVPVNFFTYPYGAYDARVIAAVKAAGYEAALTTNDGVADSNGDPYQLPRIDVPRGLGADGLAAIFKADGLIQ